MFFGKLEKIFEKKVQIDKIKKEKIFQLFFVRKKLQETECPCLEEN